MSTPIQPNGSSDSSGYSTGATGYGSGGTSSAASGSTAPGTSGSTSGASSYGSTAPAGDSGDSRPSVGELFGDISRDVSTLIRQEVALAKAELAQSVSRVGKGAGMLGGAGLAGHFVLLFLSIALWWGLGNHMGYAKAALVVALIWAIIAAVLAVLGRAQLKQAKGLPQTTATVKKIPDAVRGNEETA